MIFTRSLLYNIYVASYLGTAGRMQCRAVPELSRILLSKGGWKKILSIFGKTAKSTGKPAALAFVDYEHWFISMQRMYGERPDIRAWRAEISKDYNVKDILFFGDFSNQSLRSDIPRIREVSSSIIETQNASAFHKKDHTDFIMLDHIYQRVMTYGDDTDVFIIFSGDGHFSSVASFLVNRCEKKVVVYGVRDCLSTQLANTASVAFEWPAEKPRYSRAQAERMDAERRAARAENASFTAQSEMRSNHAPKNDAGAASANESMRIEKKPIGKSAAASAENGRKNSSARNDANDVSAASGRNSSSAKNDTSAASAKRGGAPLRGAAKNSESAENSAADKSSAGKSGASAKGVTAEKKSSAKNAAAAKTDTAKNGKTDKNGSAKNEAVGGGVSAKQSRSSKNDATAKNGSSEKSADAGSSRGGRTKSDRRTGAENTSAENRASEKSRSGRISAKASDTGAVGKTAANGTSGNAEKKSPRASDSRKASSGDAAGKKASGAGAEARIDEELQRISSDSDSFITYYRDILKNIRFYEKNNTGKTHFRATYSGTVDSVCTYYHHDRSVISVALDRMAERGYITLGSGFTKGSKTVTVNWDKAKADGLSD